MTHQTAIPHLEAAEAELTELPNDRPFFVGNADTFKDHIEAAKAKLTTMPHAVVALDTILSFADEMVALGNRPKSTIHNGAKTAALAGKALAMMYVVRDILGLPLPDQFSGALGSTTQH